MTRSTVAVLEAMIATYVGNSDVMSFINAVFIPNDAASVGISQHIIDLDIASYRKMMAAQFGGCTLLVGVGGWVSSLGVLVDDNVSVLVSFSSELTEDMVFTVSHIAKNINRDFNQDCVGVILNNKFRLVFEKSPVR